MKTYKIMNGPDSKSKFLKMLKKLDISKDIDPNTTAETYNPRDRTVRFPANLMDNLLEQGKIRQEPNNNSNQEIYIVFEED